LLAASHEHRAAIKVPPATRTDLIAEQASG
jgi:hypothetical protein